MSKYRTIQARDRVESSPHYDPPTDDAKYGYYGGRPIIGHDTRINGGVYLGAGAREAIVVDDTKQRNLLPVYRALRQAVVESSQWRRCDIVAPNQRTMSAVLGHVQRAMPYNSAIVHEITASYPPDTKMSLGSFIEHGGGECRHQALLAGYLLEKMVDEKLLYGEAHAERRTTPTGAHAWARYTPEGVDPAIDSFIIDPAQNFTGRQADAMPEAFQVYSPIE